MKKTTLLAVAGACLLGCSHMPAPNQEVASSLAAVRAAEEAGAADIPEAELHMKLAQEQLAQARELIADDRNAKARDKALRARNDAELALSLTHEHEAKSKLAQFTQALPSSGGEQTQQGVAQ